MRSLRRSRSGRTGLPDFVAAEVLRLFDALPDVFLFVKDRDSRFVRANAAWLALHGFTSEAAVLGKSDYDLN